MPSFAAISTRSASESAFIFRITLAWCAFTVISLISSYKKSIIRRPSALVTAAVRGGWRTRTWLPGHRSALPIDGHDDSRQWSD
jgi:hypothetical protein